MRLRNIVMSVALCWLAPLQAGLADDAVRLRLSDAMPSSSPLAKVARAWARGVEQACPDVDVVLYPGGQLFKPVEQINAVARSYIEAAIIHFDYWGQTLPELAILSKPFLFADPRFVDAFRHSALNHYLEAELEKKGMKVVAWLVMGELIGIASSGSPLVGERDFAGKKIRGLGPLLNASLRAAGASPVSMGGAEVYQALQTGMIDASLSAVTSILMRRFYEVNDWVVISPMFPAMMMLTVNLDYWNSLSPQNREAILRVSLETERLSLELIRELEKETPGLLREKGMQVHFLDAQEMESLRARIEPAWISTFHELAGERGELALRYSSELAAAAAVLPE